MEKNITSSPVILRKQTLVRFKVGCPMKVLHFLSYGHFYVSVIKMQEHEMYLNVFFCESRRNTAGFVSFCLKKIITKIYEFKSDFQKYEYSYFFFFNIMLFYYMFLFETERRKEMSYMSSVLFTSNKG